MTFRDILEYSFLNIGDFHLSLFHLIAALIIISGARILVWLLSRLMENFFRKKKVDPGRQFAFQQFAKYIIYTAALLMAMETMGFSLSVLWGGAAALMVGIGLGLQQTFNDLISGLILLIEGSVEVDDVIEVDGIVGTVTTIGIRTSRVETRDQISILIPNSKLVGDKTTNWTHNTLPTRFQVTVGVAYSSDIDLVTTLLLTAAKENPEVLQTPAPAVHLKDFGNSSLDFTLHFFSNNPLRIELTKSELRYRITKSFRTHQVEIPFPQTDLWLRNAETLTNHNL